MDILKLERTFEETPEVEVVRIMTNNFDVGSFETIKTLLPVEIGNSLSSAIKFRNHLGIASIPLATFIEKMNTMESNSKREFFGKVSKPCGYSGVLLQDSKTLVGTVDELVSPNEFTYYLKLYPWYVKPANDTFLQYAEQLGEQQIFMHLPSFDLTSLVEKQDVVKVTSKGIHLTNKMIIPIKEVN